MLAAFLGGGCSQLVERSNAGIGALETAAGPVGDISRGAKYAGWCLGAPAVAAMVPVAAVAWATPWVDLSMATDLAGLPAIGMGYAVEGVVGFPLHALRSLWGTRTACETSPASVPVPAPCIPWGFLVEHLEAPREPRPADPVPPEIEDYYRPLDPDRIRLSADLAAAESAAGDSSPITVELHLGIPADLEYYPASGAAPGPARPLVLITPPLEAAFAARYLARRFARRGVHAALVVPRGPILETRLTPADLEARFRAAVVSARAALHVLARRPEVDRERLLYLGVSAGGIFGGVLIAVEPAIRRAVLVLPGGDLPRIVAGSVEPSVIAYRESWNERGLAPEALAAAIAREVRTDPIRLARHVDPRRVLLFLGASDTVVPVETGLALRDALGAPETYLLSGNHDTACLCFGFILRQVDGFLFEKS